MRTTQYIGLTKDAQRFVKYMAPKRIVITQGMFDEDVLGCEYVPQMASAHEGTIFREIVQAEPWSSGPMIFTCLLNTQTGEKMFEWINENCSNGEWNEFSEEEGKFYV